MGTPIDEERSHLLTSEDVSRCLADIDREEVRKMTTEQLKMYLKDRGVSWQSSWLHASATGSKTSQRQWLQHLAEECMSDPLLSASRPPWSENAAAIAPPSVAANRPILSGSLAAITPPSVAAYRPISAPPPQALPLLPHQQPHAVEDASPVVERLYQPHLISAQPLLPTQPLLPAQPHLPTVPAIPLAHAMPQPQPAWLDWRWVTELWRRGWAPSWPLSQTPYSTDDNGTYPAAVQPSHQHSVPPSPPWPLSAADAPDDDHTAAAAGAAVPAPDSKNVQSLALIAIAVLSVAAVLSMSTLSQDADAAATAGTVFSIIVGCIGVGVGSLSIGVRLFNSLNVPHIWCALVIFEAIMKPVTCAHVELSYLLVAVPRSRGLILLAHFIMGGVHTSMSLSSRVKIGVLVHCTLGALCAAWVISLRSDALDGAAASLTLRGVGVSMWAGYATGELLRNRYKRYR